MVIKKAEIQKADMHNRKSFLVFLTAVELVVESAEVGEGAFRPV